jgi:hypothetical protein
MPTGLDDTDDKNYYCLAADRFCHTLQMLIPSTGRDIRARVPLRVFLRMTAMDVCCGPPASR